MWRIFLVSGLGEPQRLWHLGRFRFFWLQQLSGRASSGFTRGPLAAWPAASCAANFNQTVAEVNNLCTDLIEKWWKSHHDIPVCSAAARLTTTTRIVYRSHMLVFTPTEKETAAGGIWWLLKMMCRKKKSWRSSRRVRLVLFVNKQKEEQTIPQRLSVQSDVRLERLSSDYITEQETLTELLEKSFIINNQACRIEWQSDINQVGQISAPNCHPN